MNLNELETGDVVLLHNDKLAVISEIDRSRPKNSVGIFMNGSQYHTSPSNIKGVVGIAYLDKIKELAASDEQRSARSGPLAGVDIGDEIKVRINGGIKTVKYEGYKPRNRKYPLIYSRNGHKYKASMNALETG